MIKKIDRYIIKKFLSTFFYCLSLLIILIIVIDLSEKIDDFINWNEQNPNEKIEILPFFFSYRIWIYIIISSIINLFSNKLRIVPSIILLGLLTVILIMSYMIYPPIQSINLGSEYYLYMVPSLVNEYSPLFIFISVIFFTSRLSENTEIIAIFNSGMSMFRFLRPYILTSIFLSVLSFFLSSYAMPYSNKKKFDFETKYGIKEEKFKKNNIHIQLNENTFIYIKQYFESRKKGYYLSIDELQDNNLISKLRSNKLEWNTHKKQWDLAKTAYKRIFNSNGSIDSVNVYCIDTNLLPINFAKENPIPNSMDISQLVKYINIENKTGSGKGKFYEIEYHKRFAYPVAIIILTFIGVIFSYKKRKGGIGKNLAIGILISFSYILFYQFSSTFSINSDLAVWIGVWSPNLIFIMISILLYIYRRRI